MRVLHQDRKAGEIKVQVNTLDDLWHLYNIINQGDIVVASTYRRDEQKTDKIRAERAEKKRMTLGIRVERVEFHEFESRLRILGVIEEGPQDLGAHHTLNVEEGEVITIRKLDWKDSQLQRLKRAVDDTKKPKIIFVSLENDDAIVAIARQFGMQEVAHITAPSAGKMYEQKEGQDFYSQIIEKVKQVSEEAVPIVILGPGFAKEGLLTEGKEKEPEIFKRASIYHTGQAGMTGIHELMKKGLGTEVVLESRVAQETKIVETVLEEIAKDAMVAYGPADVEKAVQMGAVSTLVVLDRELRERNLESLLSQVERARGTVLVISEHHEAGRKLDSIGGIAALLRFRLESS